MSKKDIETKEVKDLERLTEKFSQNSGTFDIQGNFVYGYVNNKRLCLGSFAEYTRYKTLKKKYGNPIKKQEVDKEKEESYKFFLESQKPRELSDRT